MVGGMLCKSDKPYIIIIITHACPPTPSPRPPTHAPEPYWSGRPSMSTPFPLLSIDTCWMCGASLDSAWGGRGGAGEEAGVQERQRNTIKYSSNRQAARYQYSSNRQAARYQVQ